VGEDERSDTVSLGELVAAESVLVGRPLADDASAIAALGNLLVEVGATSADYAAACIARERTDPTGLPAALGVAIPHGDPSLVRSPAVAVAVPPEPVTFRQMGDPDVTVAAHVIFLLAVQSGAAQLRALREVAALVQDEGRLRSIVAARTPEDVLAVVRQADEDVVEEVAG